MDVRIWGAVLMVLPDGLTAGGLLKGVSMFMTPAREVMGQIVRVLLDDGQQLMVAHDDGPDANFWSELSGAMHRVSAAPKAAKFGQMNHRKWKVGASRPNGALQPRPPGQ